MNISNDRRPQGSDLALGSLLSAALAACVGISVLAQQPLATPQTFHTTAHFSVDADVLSLQTAVAISEPHARFKEFSWLQIYFYAFPLTADDVAGADDVRGASNATIRRYPPTPSEVASPRPPGRSGQSFANAEARPGERVKASPWIITTGIDPSRTGLVLSNGSVERSERVCGDNS